MIDPQPLLVLYVGESDEDLHSLTYMLVRAGYLVKARRVACWADLLTALLTVPWQMVVATPGLPALSLEQTATALKQADVTVPLIVVAGRMVDAQFGPALRAGLLGLRARGPLVLGALAQALAPLNADPSTATTTSLTSSDLPTALGLAPINTVLSVGRP